MGGKWGAATGETRNARHNDGRRCEEGWKENRMLRRRNNEEESKGGNVWGEQGKDEVEVRGR